MNVFLEMQVAIFAGCLLGMLTIVSIVALGGWSATLIKMTHAKLDEARALDLSDKVSGRIDERIDRAVDRIKQRLSDAQRGIGGSGARETIARAEAFLQARGVHGNGPTVPAGDIGEMPDEHDGLPIEEG